MTNYNPTADTQGMEIDASKSLPKKAATAKAGQDGEHNHDTTAVSGEDQNASDDSGFDFGPAIEHVTKAIGNSRAFAVAALLLRKPQALAAVAVVVAGVALLRRRRSNNQPEWMRS